MTKAKAGVIDYFDLVRGFQKGDITRAHPYETDFLHSVFKKTKSLIDLENILVVKRVKVKGVKNNGDELKIYIEEIRLC